VQRRIVTAVLVALAAGVLGLLALTVLLPRLASGAALTVRSGSMSPALGVGDLVIDRHVDPGTLRVGDIATYEQPSGVLITHRIVAIRGTGTSRSFTFRGDANPVADPSRVPADAIRGELWFSVPYVGTLRDRLARAHSVVVIAAVLALGGYAFSQFAAVARDRRGRR
jgi:signal peptidase